MSFIKHPFFLFVLKAAILYIVWYGLYDLWLSPEGTIDLWIIDIIITQSAYLLELYNYDLINDNIYDASFRTLGLDGTHGVWIGNSCNGLTVFALFTGFITAFKGKIIHKLWYIPIGLITIHLLNVIRVAALCIILKDFPDSLDFNHTYTFTTIIYAYIFGLWYLWANKISEL